jgi:Tol biopolymer transport system component
MKLVTLLLAPGLASSAAGGELLTPESLWKLARAGKPQVSPDGRYLCFEVTRYDFAENRSNADLHLLDLGSGQLRRLTTSDRSDTNARFSPDGARVGFVSSRDGKPQVWSLPLAGGEPEAITAAAEGVANFSWSPDGARIAFTSAVRIDPELKIAHPDLPKVEARLYDDLLFRHWDQWADGTYSHLFVQQIGAKEPVDLMPGERFDTPLVPNGGPEEIAWAPDGKELCYTAKKGANQARTTDADLYLVTFGPEGAPATRCITDGMDGNDRAPLYSPVGKWIAFASMERPGF